MAAYYNEIDPYAAQWLRNLIAAGHIAPGDVDERSIVDVRADDLRGYRQCHFFAGIGVWSYALRRAGWPDDRPVWTGSCPCQPFSAAGRSGGFGDGRHLWPHFFGLIRESGIERVFGEQVASADGLAWLDFVCADLEAAGYAVGAVDTCAAGFGAPHIRQRLYFVADTLRRGAGYSCKLADPDGWNASAEGLQRSGEHGFKPQDGCAGGLGDPESERRERWQDDIDAGRRERASGQAGPTNGFWSNAHWLPCIDGKARPTKSGLFPLAYGIAGRVGKLRAAGNAICAPQAEEFIRAYLQCTAE